MEMNQKTADKASDLINDLTIHGVSKLVRPQHKIVTLIWSIALLASFAYCALIITNNIIDYFRYPVITNIETVNEKNPDFPQVTFCNFNEEFFNECKFNSIDCPHTHLRMKDDTCTSFNSGINKYQNETVTILRSKDIGSLQGLVLSLKQSENESLEIFIHPQNVSEILKKAITLPLDSHIKLTLKKVIIKRLGTPYSN